MRILDEIIEASEAANEFDDDLYQSLACGYADKLARALKVALGVIANPGETGWRVEREEIERILQGES